MRHTLSILAIAAFTMVASLAVLQPIGADAADGEEVKTAETLVAQPSISVPTLEEDGVKVTMKMAKDDYAVGDKPSMTIEFVNSGKEAVEKSIQVTMLSRSTAEERSRMPSIASTVWIRTVSVSLGAGETKSVTVEAEVALSAQETYSFQLGAASETLALPAEPEKATVEKPIR